jgi:hypothetical protein
MKSLVKIPKPALIALAGIAVLVVLIIIAEAMWGDIPSAPNGQNIPETAAPLTIDDIESIFIHSGLDIDCPDLKGVAQNGYVYSVVLNGKIAAIERLGCGVGEPEVFAAAIAQDLDLNGNFETLPVDQVLEKMTFKFYELNNN